MPVIPKTVRVALIFVAAASLSGCGGGKEDSLAVPAPAPKPPTEIGVSKPATGGTAAPETASTTPPPPTAAAGQTAGAVPAGPEDEFKGMTPKQIEEFKKNATPETHDTNIGLVAQAVLAYNGEFGHAPASLEQLVSTGFLHHVPKAPKGKKYVIDAKTLSVKSVDL